MTCWTPPERRRRPGRRRRPRHPPWSEQELRDGARTACRTGPATARALDRTVELPPDNLDRVLDRLDRLRPGDRPRPAASAARTRTAAVLTVRTQQADGVTALDVDLARRIDDAIDEVGAGMAAG